MKRASFADMRCCVAQTLEVVGEWWTPLILRDAFMGVTRFDDFQQSLGIARNVLTARLNLLVERGVFEKVRYQEHPERFEYRLTPAGRDLFPIVATLQKWGLKHTEVPLGPHHVLVHGGHEARPVLICSHCGEELTSDNSRAVLIPSEKRLGS